MNGETLRRAATVLRGRVEATRATTEQVTEGWWTESEFVEAVEETYLGGVPGAREDGAYIETMRPAVGAALADWLEYEANSADAGMSIGINYPSQVIARHILGENQ